MRLTTTILLALGMIGGVATWAQAAALSIGDVVASVEVDDPFWDPAGIVVREEHFASGPGQASLAVATPNEQLSASLDYQLLHDPARPGVADFQITSGQFSVTDSPALAIVRFEVEFTLTRAMPFIFTADVDPPGVANFAARLNDEVASRFPDRDANFGLGGTMPFMEAFKLEGILPAGEHTFSYSMTEGTARDQTLFDSTGVARLQLIPEPASAALLAMGGVALLRRRSRRTAADRV